MAELEELGLAHEFAPYRSQHDSRGELRIQPLPHNPLQPQTRTNKPKPHKRQRIPPRRFPSITRYAPLARLPEYYRANGEEDSLDHRAEEEPYPRLDTHAVANAAEEGTHVEGDEGAECLLVGDVKAEVLGCTEETGDGECELTEVTSLKSTPDEDGREGDNVDVSRHQAVRSKGPRGLMRVHFHPQLFPHGQRFPRMRIGRIRDEIRSTGVLNVLLDHWIWRCPLSGHEEREGRAELGGGEGKVGGQQQSDRDG